MRFVDQRLGGDAGDVDAGAAVHFVRAFDDGNGLSLIREIGGQRLASFPESDNDGVIALLRHILLVGSCGLFRRSYLKVNEPSLPLYGYSFEKP